MTADLQLFENSSIFFLLLTFQFHCSQKAIMTHQEMSWGNQWTLPH